MSQSQIVSGDSYTVTVVFEDSIDMSNINDFKLSFFTKKSANAKYSFLHSDGDFTASGEDNVFGARLSSNDTKDTYGDFQAYISVDYNDIGVRNDNVNNPAFSLSILKNKDTISGAIYDTEGSEATIIVRKIVDDLTFETDLAKYYRGYSNYELAVNNGHFTGTEEEYAAYVAGKEYQLHVGVQIATGGDAWFHNRISQFILLTFLEPSGRKLNPQLDYEILDDNSVKIYANAPFNGNIITQKINNDVFVVSGIQNGDRFEHGQGSEMILWQVLDESGRVINTIELVPDGINHVLVYTSLWDSLFSQDFDGYFYIKAVQ